MENISLRRRTSAVAPIMSKISDEGQDDDEEPLKGMTGLYTLDGNLLQLSLCELYIPRAVIKYMLIQSHDSLCSWYFGYMKTMDRLKNLVCTNNPRDVNRNIKGCDAFHRNESRYQKPLTQP